jgi:hypothetical protein
MKAFLMHRDRDFDVAGKLPANADELTQDLELPTLFDAMAGDDEFLHDVVRRAVFLGLTDPVEIRYRQDVLADCIANAAAVRHIYDLAFEAIERERKNWGFGRDYPSGRLHRAVEVLTIFVEMLRKLRDVAEAEAPRFRSEGFTTFFAMLRKELGDDFFAEVNDHLRRLRFRDGVLISARLGTGNKGADYVLRRPRDNGGWFARLLGPWPEEYTFYLAPRDESGARAMGELRDQGIALVANAMAQSTDHILSFFRMLRQELAFYIGCVNLHEYLVDKGAPSCFPDPLPLNQRALSCAGLYDVCLALTLDRKVVGNDVEAPGVRLTMITGANQGGKSTFLRSVGLAQLMMQAGMFVAAEAFSANVADGLFTHYKREEDTTMRSGKLDEELARMSVIVDRVRPDSLVLFNESFAATNEREGSEIARQIVRALLDRGLKVVFVTHLYELAHRFHLDRRPDALFLRAERREDGTRSFKLIEGEPLETAYGEDLYDAIFLGRGAVAAAPEAAAPAPG